MNNILVFCEITEEQQIAEVSLELCSKARKLADSLSYRLDAIVIGNDIRNIEEQLYPYGVDSIFYLSDFRLSSYQTIPFFSIITKLISEETPDIVLFGATSVGRDIAPRVASYLRCGLTADCTNLEIGSHHDAKNNKTYDNILYQIRPAFGGNIIATIVSPETRPQMATVREGALDFKSKSVNKRIALQYFSSLADHSANNGVICPRKFSTVIVMNFCLDLT